MKFIVCVDKSVHVDAAPVAVGEAFRRHARALTTDPWRKGDKLSPKGTRGPAWLRSVPNLYRMAALPEGWRALYTIEAAHDATPARVIIVWLGTHKQYDRLLGYG